MEQQPASLSRNKHIGSANTQKKHFSKDKIKQIHLSISKFELKTGQMIWEEDEEDLKEFFPGPEMLKGCKMKSFLTNWDLSRDPGPMFPSGAVCQHVGGRRFISYLTVCLTEFPVS